MKMMLTFRIIFSDLLKSKSRAENNLKNKIKRRVLILLFDSSAFKSIKSMILTLLDVFFTNQESEKAQVRIIFQFAIFNCFTELIHFKIKLLE